MRDEAFAEWLHNVDGRDDPQTSDNFSRAKRVECALSALWGGSGNLDS